MTIGQVLPTHRSPRRLAAMPALGGVRGRHLFVVDLDRHRALDRRLDGAALRFAAVRRRSADLLPGGALPVRRAAADQRHRRALRAGVGLCERRRAVSRSPLVVLAGSIVGIVFFYGVLVPLGVPGTTTSVGHFPRSFFVLEGLLTLAGMGGARFLVRASTEWKGWRPGDPDRRRRKATPGRSDRCRRSSTARATSARPSCERSPARVTGLGMRVVGLLDDDRAQAQPDPARAEGARLTRRPGRDRASHRRTAAADRHPVGIGRRRPARRPRRDGARARDPDGPVARRARVGSAGRRGDPRGPGRGPAPTRAGRHR